MTFYRKAYPRNYVPFFLRRRNYLKNHFVMICSCLAKILHTSVGRVVGRSAGGSAGTGFDASPCQSKGIKIDIRSFPA